MIVLLDTNVAIDYLLQRNQYEVVNKIIDMAINFQEIECITTTTITDIHYVVRKNGQNDGGESLSSLQVQDMLRELFRYIEMIDVTADDVHKAMSLRWNDLEDAVQYCVALSNGVDCIVTNNVKDFINAEIDIFSPEEFLKYIEKQQLK